MANGQAVLFNFKDCLEFSFLSFRCLVLVRFVVNLSAHSNFLEILLSQWRLPEVRWVFVVLTYLLLVWVLIIFFTDLLNYEVLRVIISFCKNPTFVCLGFFDFWLNFFSAEDLARLYCQFVQDFRLFLSVLVKEGCSFLG